MKRKFTLLNYRRSSIAIVIVLLTIALNVQAQNNFSLCGTWQFSLAANEREATVLDGFHSLSFKGANFRSVPVPSNWAVLGYEEPVYRGFEGDTASEGFYIKQFTIPADFRKKRVLLHFGGVWSSAEVWLNGEYLGEHFGGYTSFAFNVTGKLKESASNRLAVRVRQVNRDYKFDTYDDWTLGGIYRDVYLEAMPKNRWLDEVVIHTSFDNNFENADLAIRTMVSDKNKATLPGNYPSPGTPYDLVFTLFSKDSKVVARRQVTVPAHISTDREIKQIINIQNPVQWNAENPYLYRLQVDLLEDGKVSHTRTEQVGFRQISTQGGVFRINGQAVKLRGVNRHDEHPDVGRATTRAHWLKDIQMMKEANINYIRLSHYAHAKGFIELCDSLGMYVGGEVSLGGAGELMHDPSFSGSVLQRTYETVSRDINSPSVVYWSVGNEDPLTTLHMASVKLVKALDPTRPVLLPWRHETWLPEEIDILAPHYWQPREYDQLAAKSDRPIITTEYTHAFGLDGMGGLEERWKALTKHPSGTGGAIWMWADQGIKTTVPKPAKVKGDLAPSDLYLRLDADGWDGIVDSYRNLTNDYYEVKAVYAQVYPLVSEIEFTPGQKFVTIPIQNEYDFTNLDQIKISWFLREDEKELNTGTGNIKVEPHAAGTIDIPVSDIKSIQNGKTYYLWLIFYNKANVEINRKAVALKPLIAPAPYASSNSLSLNEGEFTKIVVGDVCFVFNPKTGQLITGEIKNKPVITDLKPVIWKKTDRGEASVIGSKIAPKAVDLNRYKQLVEKWEVINKQDYITIYAKVNYVIDEENKFTTNYHYTISNDNKLRVHYEILPQVEVPSLPIIGMALKSTPGLENIRWCGLGPYDAYPNKQSAPILGVWSDVIGGKTVTGNKATQWIERFNQENCLRINNMGYMRNDSVDKETTYLLSGVLGRPEKGRKPDDPSLLLQTGDSNTFVGEFIIELTGKLN